jgi:hypothetical protein
MSSAIVARKGLSLTRDCAEGLRGSIHSRGRQLLSGAADETWQKSGDDGEDVARKKCLRTQKAREGFEATITIMMTIVMIDLAQCYPIEPA